MKTLASLIISIAVAGAIAFVDVADAEACSPALETVSSTIPDDGGQAPSDTRILLLMDGGVYGDQEISLYDENSEPVAGEAVWESMAGLFSGYREFIPDENLEPGHYTLELTYPESGLDDFEMSFQVPEILEPWPQPEAVDFEWYQETFEEDRGDSCYYNDEFNQVAIEPLEIPPAYYEILFSRGEGSELVHLHKAEDIDGQLRSYELSGVECVTVSAGRMDGTHGPAVEKCVPDKCKHYEDDGYMMGITDWEDVSGCNGDGDDGDDGDDDDNGDDGDGDDDNGDNGELSFDDENQTEDSGCSTTSGFAPSSLFLLVVAGMLASVRRRRKIIWP